jgi:hypothetical protein
VEQGIVTGTLQPGASRASSIRSIQPWVSTRGLVMMGGALRRALSRCRLVVAVNGMGLPAWRICQSFLWRERDERLSFCVARARRDVRAA